MRLARLWLRDFRSYEAAELEPGPGVTLVVGGNGQGKTNLLEAVGYLAALRSFRGVPTEALVRDGADRAAVRAEVVRDGRSLLIEAELVRGGRDRVLVNRQPLRRARELLGALRVTVFSPDDLALVKGGPGERRGFLDDTLVDCHPRHDALRADVERILRQRNALLRQMAERRGRPDPDALVTLDVWDARLAEAGEALGRARAELCAALEPLVGKAYAAVAGGAADVGLSYVAPWRDGGLAAALAAARAEEMRRGVGIVGPQRDDLALALAGRPARTHASQGEQRSLALALRLAAHSAVNEAAGSPPVLLLDDVFSELDPGRAEALVGALPPGQALLTTASAPPAGIVADLVVRVVGGSLEEAGGQTDPRLRGRGPDHPDLGSWVGSAGSAAKAGPTPAFEAGRGEVGRR